MGFLSSILGKNNKTEAMGMEGHQRGQIAGAGKEKDPVCKMDVDPATAAAKSEYKGKTYYFCAVGCKKAFDADPEKYLGGK